MMAGILATGSELREHGTAIRANDVATVKYEHPMNFPVAQDSFFGGCSQDTAFTEKSRSPGPGDEGPRSGEAPYSGVVGDPEMGKLCQLAGELFRGFGR